MLADIDSIVEKLETYSRSDICSSIAGCPYHNDENINCENCGAMGALQIVKEGIIHETD